MALRGVHIDGWVVLAGGMTGVAAVYFAVAGLMIHAGYNSFGWDLGIFDQLTWNTGHGRWFEYSFRDYNYLGDHFQPILLVLAPIALVADGPEGLLAVQGIAFAYAAVPLFAAAANLSDRRTAFCVVAAYLLSLSIARSVMYDFHPECFVPLFAFTALWGLTRNSPLVFVAASLGLLLVKEDMVFLVLGLSWVAWIGFGERKSAAFTAVTAIVSTLVVTTIVMPHFLGHHTNPMLERYGYLGDTLPEIAFTAIARPDLLAEHLGRWGAIEAAALVLAGVAFLPLRVPQLLPALALLLAMPLLADQPSQSNLELHYMVVPATFAVILAALALRSPADDRAHTRTDWQMLGSVALAASAVLVFAWKSPLPPGFSADPARLESGSHEALADEFVAMVPDDAPVSAQNAYVPHLTHRRQIFEFPHVSETEWVLVDTTRSIPAYDKHNYVRCLLELPDLGFEVVASADGITLLRRENADVRSTYCF